MESIKGIINKVNYYNSDNGYTIAILELENHKKQSFKKISVIGYLDRKPNEEEKYTFEGKYETDKKYGLQFKFQSFNREQVNDAQGVISYLTSDMFPGIGEKIAKMIVKELGVNCLEKIKENHFILDNLKITSKQKSVIVSGILSDQINQENVLFFLNNGITLDITHKIIAQFKDMAKEIVLENPYILMEKIERFGFKKNDAFALKIGIKPNSIIRLKALVVYLLNEILYSLGNSYVPKNDFYEYLTHYLQEPIDHFNFDKVINILLTEKKIYLDQNKNIYDYKLFIQELELANELAKKIKKMNHPNPVDYDQQSINKYFAQIKKHSNIEFSKEQEIAILSAFTDPIVIITGGPGTGKTTIVKAIIELYSKLNKDNTILLDYVALLAPTGKAAKRLKEACNFQAMTIHKFLGYMGGNLFTHSKFNKTDAKLIIVDESSMMDLPLASRLVTSMQEDARLIIVGDVDQLPSVGPGQVLKDLIDSKEIKTIRLNKIHRQADDSSIIKLAHNINEGILPETIVEKLNDRVFISTDNDHLSKIIIDVTSRYISRGFDIKKDIQILIPMYKGVCGINDINQQIQNLVNPLNEDDLHIKHNGNDFRINDKVIQLVNRAEKGIMNGDVGYIESFLIDDLKIKGLRVVFDNNIVSYSLEELEDLSLAYAISVHKAQGGEFNIVIMPITSRHFIMLKRKLIYTAVTRAKKILILIGDLKILQNGIKKIENGRQTILKDKLIENIASNQKFKIPEIKIDETESVDELGSIETQLKPSDFDF